MAKNKGSSAQWDESRNSRQTQFRTDMKTEYVRIRRSGRGLPREDANKIPSEVSTGRDRPIALLNMSGVKRKGGKIIGVLL